MFERLKPRKACKRAANASRHAAKHGLGKEVTGERSLKSGSSICRVGVKLINSRVLKVSLRSAAFYASYSRKTLGEVASTPLDTRPVPARVKRVHALPLLSDR